MAQGTVCVPRLWNAVCTVCSIRSGWGSQQIGNCEDPISRIYVQDDEKGSVLWFHFTFTCFQSPVMVERKQHLSDINGAVRFTQVSVLEQLTRMNGKE